MNDFQTLTKAKKLIENCVSYGSANRRIAEMISSEDFLHAVFNPKSDKMGTMEDISACVTAIYDMASKRKGIRVFVDTIDRYGYRNMNRASATFLVNLVNLGMASIDAAASDLGRELDHGEIGQSDFNAQMRKLNSYQEDLRQLLKYARHIVKPKAKVMAAKTGAPKNLCYSALFTVPGPEYIDSFKVAFYTKAITSNIYGMVNSNPDAFEEDYDDIAWSIFFRVVFGKDRLPDVASMILLEGASDIDRFDNVRDVKACWNAITNFALRTLNQAPESIRDHMIDVYCSRLNKMLADHNLDFRIDLRLIDEFDFKALADTVKKYKSKLDDIMAKARMATAAPESSPVC